MKFNSLSLALWAKKYFAKGEKLPAHVFRRVAKAISKGDITVEETYHTLLSSMKFIPGGRILNGAGTVMPYLLNCFFEPVPDSLDMILEANKRSGIIFQKNGGCGYNFSTVRPKNHPLSTGGTASGPVSFMHMFDATGETIKSGGHARRAAQIAVLNCDHGDIYEFIDAKREEGKLTNFNISVGITAQFISRVHEDINKIAIELNDGNILEINPEEEIEVDGRVMKARQYRDEFQKTAIKGVSS